MNQDRKKLFLTIIATLLVLVGVVLYAYLAFYNRQFDFKNLVVVILPLLIVVFMAFFLARRYKDIKKGMPFEDERSKKVINRAAAMSFYITLYWLLFISWFEALWLDVFGLEDLSASEAIGVGIIGMAVIFFCSWLFYSRRGDVI